MPLSCSVVLIVLLVNIVYAVLPNYLVYTPQANFPVNETEIGYDLNYYTIKSEVFDKGFYLNHNFTKNIRYGIDYYRGSGNQSIAHHLAVRLGHIYKNTNQHFVFAVSMNYLSDKNLILKNSITYNETITVSWVPKEFPFNIHLSAAKQRNENKIIYMSALSYLTDWGVVSLEWDNKFLNISSQFNVENKIKFRAGVSRSLLDDSELTFKTSIGILDHSFFPEKEVVVSSNRIENEKKVALNTSAGLIHIQEGLQFYYDGNYRKARKSYLLASKFFPYSSIVYERLGSTHFKLGDYDKAYSAWEKANAIQSSDRLQKYILEAKSRLESQF